MKNKTQKTKKHLKKVALKSITALVLCMATIIGSIGVNSSTSYAAAKKVAATACAENKLNYPKITKGTTHIILKCKKWNTNGCVQFKADKTGTYKFTLKNPAPGMITMVTVSTIPPIGYSPDELHLGKAQYQKGKAIYSGKIKMKKGKKVYITAHYSSPKTNRYANGTITLVITKVK